MIDRPDAFLREVPRARNGSVPPRQQPPQLLRAVAGAIRQAVLEAHHAHRAAVARTGSEQIELMLEQVRDLLDDACAAPLSFMEQQQRRRLEGDEEGLR